MYRKRKISNIKATNNKQGGKEMKIIDKIALVLIIIGAINWGLIALFELDLVALLFGEMTILSRIVYSITIKTNCRNCVGNFSLKYGHEPMAY